MFFKIYKTKTVACHSFATNLIEHLKFPRKDNLEISIPRKAFLKTAFLKHKYLPDMILIEDQLAR